VTKSDAAPRVVSAAEFLLEGLVAHRKLSRSEERVFSGKPTAPHKPERADLEIEYDEWQRARRTPRGGYN
jgi:magnesium chelatase subunit I